MSNSSLKLTWRKAVDEFLLDLAVDKAPKTIKFYRTQLTPLTRWMGTHDIDLEEFAAKHLKQYLI